MKKLFALIAGFAVTAATIATVAVVSGTNQSALAASCTNGTKYTDFNGSRSGNTLTVSPKKKLCKDVKVNFTTFKVLNKNYNGKPFHANPTALPQAYFWNKTVTFKKGSTSKVSVAMQTPDACTPYQIDAYVGKVQTKITTSAGLVGTTAIVGKIFDKTKTNCNPPVEKTIKVCRLSDKAYPVTIKEKDFDSSKYSKNPADCKPAEKTIEVCRLEDKAYPVTIKESEFDTTKYSKDASDCAEETPMCEVPGKENLPVDSKDCKEETPKELPHTGPAEAFMSLLGLGALTGTGAAYFRSRR